MSDELEILLNAYTGFSEDLKFVSSSKKEVETKIKDYLVSKELDSVTLPDGNVIKLRSRTVLTKSKESKEPKEPKQLKEPQEPKRTRKIRPLVV